jgi:hypothetical protein
MSKYSSQPFSSNYVQPLFLPKCQIQGVLQWNILVKKASLDIRVQIGIERDSKTLGNLSVNTVISFDDSTKMGLIGYASIYTFETSA